MIKLIMFDIGGVIEDYTEEQYIDYICAKLKIDKKQFEGDLFRIIPSSEEGRISTREMLKRVALFSGVKSYRLLEWSQAIGKLGKIDLKVAGLVNALKRNYRVVLLSNVSHSRYMEVRATGFFKKCRPDRVYASCYLKMAKPDQKVYRYVLKKERMTGEETVFIDNLLVNVRGAERVGIKGVHFVGYAKLVEDLKKMGIKW
jgi:FMN phosphatase YigB (HAD superfamily)